MENLWITILGAVQGATEFLPVSSSGHLAAGQMLMDGGDLGRALKSQPMLLEVLLHVATLLAVLIVYRKHVIGVIGGAITAAVALLRGRLPSTIALNDDANLAAAIVIGTIPTGILGLALKDHAATVANSPTALGLCFLGCALLLVSGKWWKGGTRRLTMRDALIIGLVQGIAVLPGISRSGTTITVALALGLDREEAAKFSFLLSVPAIAGAAILELDLDAFSVTGQAIPLTMGAVAAFLVGLAALMILIRLVKDGRLWLFAPYVAAVGLASLLFF